MLVVNYVCISCCNFNFKYIVGIFNSIVTKNIYCIATILPLIIAGLGYTHIVSIPYFTSV